MKKKIWHKMKDEVPDTNRPCLIVLKDYSGALDATCYDEGYGRLFWYDESGTPRELDTVEKWVYISDILDIDEEEDNE